MTRDRGVSRKDTIMPRTLGPVAIGVLCAIPAAFLAGWFATVIFDPANADPNNFVNAALGMGPLRGVAFGVGAVLAAAILAPKIAREDVGSFGGLVRFVGLAHLFAFTGVTLEIALRDPSALDLTMLIAWPVWLVITLATSLIVWLPIAAVWVAAVRRLTIDGLVAPTDLERAESEIMRNQAAREHVVIDATNIADQGSRLYRNRG